MGILEQKSEELLNQLHMLAKLRKDKYANIFDLDACYNKCIELYQQIAQDMQLNYWLDNKVELTEDWFIANTVEWAEVQIEQQMEYMCN